MLKSVKTLSTAEFGKMVDFAVDTGTNLLVLGASGIGKTEIPRTRCTKNGHPVVYWNLSTKEATDLVGQTMIDKATMRTVYAPPADIPTDFVDADGNEIPGAVIVIDELDKCEKELQNPLLEVLDQNLRSLAGRKLNIKAVIATGNLPDEHAFAKPISHALANRCSLYRIEANLEEWVADFAIPSGISPLINCASALPAARSNRPPPAPSPASTSPGTPASAASSSSPATTRRAPPSAAPPTTRPWRSRTACARCSCLPRIPITRSGPGAATRCSTRICIQKT